MILDDQRIFAEKIIKTLAISRESVSYIILEILDMRKLSAKWVPRCLNVDQKRDRVLASEAILARFRRDPVGLFKRLVTMEETWINIYDSGTKGRKFSSTDEVTLSVGGWFAVKPKDFFWMG
jgi:histone-lysine N-methyltransferase SETMAR